MTRSGFRHFGGAVIFAILLLFAFAYFSPKTQADINPQINFQGKLTNPDGTNVTNGSYSLVFSIYTVASGGSNIWTETQGSVSVTDGIFRVALGSVTPLPGSVDFNSNSIYLGITVGADPEMSPRVQFTAAPYAFNSQRLGGLTSSSFVQLGQAAAQTDASTNNSIYLNKTAAGNIVNLQNSGVDVFTINNSGDIVFGQSANHSISVAQTSTNADGKNITFTAGQGGTGAGANAGGTAILQGGTGGGTNGNGGDVLLSGGAADGSGSSGEVIVRNASDSTTALQVQNAANTRTILAVDTVNNQVNVNGGIVVNTTDSSIIRTSSADFALGTVGSALSNLNGQLELSDGTIPNSGKGTITTAGQPAASAAIGAGAQAISRPDGDYLIIRGGGTGLDIYDPYAGTFTNSSQVLNGVAGAGALALPRPTGQYRIIHGGGLTTTSLVDPQGTVAVGGSVAVTASNAGTVAFKRPDGRFLIKTGGAAVTTSQIYNPVTDAFSAGPSITTGTAAAGSLFLSTTDGNALLIVGGATSNSQYYTSTSGAGDIGVFSVGPSLDGVQAAGTCGINGAGSVAIRKSDGKYLILSKANVYTIYDPAANNFTCSASGGPATALGDGAHAIPYEDGKFLIIVGGGSTASYVYDPSANTFTSHGTALTAITTGAFSLMRQDGTWQVITGTDTCTTGCTNNLDLGLPMNGTSARYTSDDISTTSLNDSSILKWTAQLESIYTGAANGTTNTAFSSIQFFVRTATNSSGCTAPLNAATDKELANSGESIRPAPTDNCIRITVQMNRPLPKRLTDERGTWTGNSSTVHRLDYATPTLFDIAVDNSTVLHRDNFTFSLPNAQAENNGTVPSAVTSNAPTAGGACTAGAHFWFVTFVTNGVESRMSPASGTQTCTGPNGTVSITGIPTGPTGTTARKLYRTKAAAVNTDTAFTLTTINDNTTVIFSDTVADGSLGSAFAYTQNSGPVGTRVEAINGLLTLPMGRISPSTQVGTTGYYSGVVSAAHPPLTQAQTNQSTIVIARPNKTFVVIAALTAPAANASIYDPATQTFTAQAGSSIPTAANGTGGFALKRPDGKYLVVLGNATTTTNIYDPVTNVFSAGPAMTASIGGVGAGAIPNTDGSFTIVHGNALTSSSLYDPSRNTMVAGPVTTTATNCGFWAIPLKNGQYKVFPGIADGVVGATTSMNYDPRAKVFTAGTALTTAHGCGSFAFQRQDGFWVTVAAGAGAAGADTLVTNIINPDNGTSLAGPNLSGVAGTSGPRKGAHVIPRADGTFLIVHGRQVTNTTVYIPFGGTFGVGAGIGTAAAGPALTTAADAGSLSFQRPDGKWIIVAGNATQTTMTYDAGWYGDGQYLSEQVQVPALAANTVLNWKQTADNFVRFEVKSATSQAALATASFNSVARAGQSIGNAGGETWVQVEANFRRDFPTFGGPLDGVYVSGGGMAYPYRTIAQPSVSSYSLNDGADLLTLQNDGLNVFRVTSEGSVYTASSGGFYTGGADLAENYSSTQSLLPGEVVVMDSADNHSVKRSTNQYQNDVLGVVSTSPGFIAGAYTESSYPIALVGRVPVKISTENGPIKEGDFLSSASIPGYAMKATVAGRVVGTALESFDETKAEACPSDGMGSRATTLCGSVMMFVNLTNYQGASVDALMASEPDGTFVGQAVLPGVEYSSVNGLANENQENILGFLMSLRTKQARGQIPKGGDVLANRVSAVNEIFSPVMVTDLLRANSIQANSIVGLEIFTDKVSALSNAYGGIEAQVNQSSTQGAVVTSLKDIKAEKGEFSVGLVSLGQLEARGGLIVDGLSQFNGRTTFAAMVQFMDKVQFDGDVLQKGRVTYGKDAGGIVTVKKDTNRIDVVFDKPYDKRPVITAAISVGRTGENLTPEQELLAAQKEQELFLAGYNYIVSNVSPKGFSVVLNKQALDDLDFNWSAISVESNN